MVNIKTPGVENSFRFETQAFDGLFQNNVVGIFVNRKHKAQD